MENQTSNNYFNILAFSGHAEKSLLTVVFLPIYFIGVVGNLITVTVIVIDTHLHTPMYVFLCNLSFIDVCFTTVTLPKLLDILLTDDNSISFIQCFTQMFFSIFFSSSEAFLLSFMAYDRYIAICKPLHYNLIMNKLKSIQLLVCTWISGGANAFFLIGFASTLTICYSNDIHQFYCDLKAITKITCANLRFRIILFAETIIGFLPFMVSLMSYMKIFSSILNIKSTNSKRKGFSTCISHLIVLIIFYGTIICVYLRSPSEQSQVQDQVLSVFYAAVTPMLNPVIYSLRNRDIKNALRKFMDLKIN